MSVMTEAEQERAIRERIDRVTRLREEYAARKGMHPADVRLPAEVIDRAHEEPSREERETAVETQIDGMRGRVLEACKRLANGKPIPMASIREALGVADDKGVKAVYNAIYQLRAAGKLPFAVEAGKGGRRKGEAKATAPIAPKPAGEFSALKRAINGTDRPRPAPQPEPEPEPPQAGMADPARLAELAADWCRRLDEMADDERAFLLAFVRHRYI